MILCTTTLPPKEYDFSVLVPVHGEPWISIGGYTGPHSAVAYVRNGQVIGTLWGNRPTYYSEPGPSVDAPEFAWPAKHTL